MKKLILASGLLLLLTVTACQSKHKQGSGNLEHKTLTDSSIVKIIPEYAQGFKITYTDQACLLDIQDPQNKESQSFHYALVPRVRGSGEGSDPAVSRKPEPEDSGA